MPETKKKKGITPIKLTVEDYRKYKRPSEYPGFESMSGRDRSRVVAAFNEIASLSMRERRIRSDNEDVEVARAFLDSPEGRQAGFAEFARSAMTASEFDKTVSSSVAMAPATAIAGPMSMGPGPLLGLTPKAAAASSAGSKALGKIAELAKNHKFITGLLTALGVYKVADVAEKRLGWDDASIEFERNKQLAEDQKQFATEAARLETSSMEGDRRKLFEQEAYTRRLEMMKLKMDVANSKNQQVLDATQQMRATPLATPDETPGFLELAGAAIRTGDASGNAFQQAFQQSQR